MLGKRRSRAMQSDPCKSGPIPDLADKPTIKLPQIFPSCSETDGSKSPTSPLEFNINSPNSGKSPRSWQKRDSEGVGLGIVAAMNKNNETHDAFFSSKSSRAAKLAGPVSRQPQISPRSEPIPIVPAPKFKGPILGNSDLDELSENYTCVISHHGPNSIRKQQYFADEFGGDFLWKNSCLSGGVFFESTPPKIAEITAKIAAFEPAEFLRSCYLCRKKLHGRDIFMYRGETAFCSVECRSQQIMSDEHTEKCGAEVLKTIDSSVSPCSAPRIFYAGVAAA